MGFLRRLGSIESAVVPTIGGLLGDAGGAGGGGPSSAGGNAAGENPYMTYLNEGVGPGMGVPLGQLLGEAGLGQSLDGLPGNLIGTFF